jgi:hypothetical protein
MPSLTITILHILPTSEALTKMQNLMNIVKCNERHIKNVSQTWNGHQGEFKLMFKRAIIVGKIGIQQNLVSITAQLPFLLHFLRGRIRTVIEENAVNLLSNNSSSV